MNVKDIASEIVNKLKSMDMSAGKWGLDSYGYFARPELKRPQTEVEWTKGLSAYLNELGYVSEYEVSYPHDKRKRCDIVLFEGEERLWIEVKGAWKHYWKNSKIYQSYMFNPLVPNLPDKGHSCVLDVQKKLFKLPENVNKMFVLLGFDSEKYDMTKDVAELEILLQGEIGGWSRVSESWINPSVDSLRTKVWIYYS